MKKLLFPDSVVCSNSIVYPILICLSMMFCLLMLSKAFAQNQVTPTEPSVEFKWEHPDPESIDGFRLYTFEEEKKDELALVKEINDPNTMSAEYSWTGSDGEHRCFGVVAFGPGGESRLVTQTHAGRDLCLGKLDGPGNIIITGPIFELNSFKQKLNHPDGSPWMMHWCFSRETVCQAEDVGLGVLECRYPFVESCREWIKQPHK